MAQDFVKDAVRDTMQKIGDALTMKEQRQKLSDYASGIYKKYVPQQKQETRKVVSSQTTSKSSPAKKTVNKKATKRVSR